LGKFEVVGIAGHAPADQAGPRCDEPQMGLVPLADGLWSGATMGPIDC
jgi:hypothetical protein